MTIDHQRTMNMTLGLLAFGLRSRDEIYLSPFVSRCLSFSGQWRLWVSTLYIPLVAYLCVVEGECPCLFLCFVYCFTTRTSFLFYSISFLFALELFCVDSRHSISSHHPSRATLIFPMYSLSISSHPNCARPRLETMR